MECIDLYIKWKAVLGEGPCWHPEKKRFYWVDILNRHLLIHDPIRETTRTLSLPHPPGAAVPRKSGGFLLAMGHGFATLDESGKHLQPIATPEAHRPNNRFNDGKCDPSGRFIAGTMNMNETGNSGALYALDQDMSPRTLLTGVTISNGLAWSPDTATMYYIDTPTRRIDAFAYDKDTGTLSNRRTVIPIPATHGWPDGMTIDREGMLWVALWDGGAVTRWNPHNGKLLQKIPLPAPRVTSCTFGGGKMSELYVTTARVGLTQGQLQHYPLSGSVFRIDPGVAGFPNPEFNG